MSSYYDQDDDAYVFEFNGNLVTAVYEYEHGRLEYERIKSYETWSFDGTTVTKTEVEHGVTETSTYTDLDGDGLYTQASHSYGSSSASESDTTSELSDDSYIGESKVFSADDSHNDTDDSAGDDYLGSSDVCSLAALATIHSTQATGMMTCTEGTETMSSLAAMVVVMTCMMAGLGMIRLNILPRRQVCLST